MLIEEIIPLDDLEENIAWGRSGNKLTKKYRCMSGPRKGRVVSNPAQCTMPLDIKKSIRFKQTKRMHGPKMARKAKRTKRINPASRLARLMNKKRK